MKGTNRETVSLQDILIEGNLTWQGSLKKEVSIEINGTVVFPEEGEWGILEWSRSSPEKIMVNRQGVFLHIGREESRFGWVESHDSKLGDEDIKPMQSTIPSRESQRDNPKSSEKGQITVSSSV